MASLNATVLGLCLPPGLSFFHGIVDGSTFFITGASRAEYLYIPILLHVR